MFQGKNIWLIKPNDFNRGRGVKLFNNLEQLKELIKEFTLTQNNQQVYSQLNHALSQISQNQKSST
jgi:hypothetical protein